MAIFLSFFYRKSCKQNGFLLWENCVKGEEIIGSRNVISRERKSFVTIEIFLPFNKHPNLLKVNLG